MAGDTVAAFDAAVKGGTPAVLNIRIIMTAANHGLFWFSPL